MPAPSHFEIAPFPKGTFKNGAFFGQRRVECASDDLATLLAYFDTYPNEYWPYNYGGLSQTALCIEATVYPKPGGKVTSSTTPLIDYGRAWIDLTYSTHGMRYVGGRYLWESFDAGLQPYPNLRPMGLLWGSDNQPILNAHISLQVPHGTLKISQFKLAVSPPNLGTLMGCTNNASYTTSMLGYTFATDTLLYAGAHVERGSPGSLTSDWLQAHHVLLYNSIGWNKAWRVETNTFENVLLPTGAAWKPQTQASLAGVLT
jgi:hypothetical protein